VVRIPEVEKLEVAQVFASYGLTEAESTPVIAALSARPQAWVDFMMRFELGLEEPQPGRALRSALTIALAYTVRGG
jgi:vacuolar iron transporter family protein